jgi:hypothetical protein
MSCLNATRVIARRKADMSNPDGAVPAPDCFDRQFAADNLAVRSQDSIKHEFSSHRTHVKIKRQFLTALFGLSARYC